MEPNDQTPGLVPPIDLEVRVTTPWGRGGRSLEFVLNSPSGVADFFQEQVSGSPIHDPEKFQRRLFEQLEGLHRGLDVDSEHILRQEVFHELTTIGHDLYQTLFPRAMRTIYGSFRNQVKTLLVISDEPWIPWEILRPFDFEDDDFFCMKFQMSRWLTGETVLAAEKRIGRFLCLGSGEGSGLAGAGSELRFLQDLLNETRGVDGTFQSHVPAQDLGSLLEEQSFDLLHFTGHGEHDENRPGEAKIVLDGRALRARHLSPAAEKKLRSERPVVFFNSCQLGRLGRSLTDLDGWAPRWVRRCGCSAFLAPFWSVQDARALRFAQAFYGELREGRTLGEAVLIARHELRDEDPHEMTWLAYSLYGHPCARILFGDHQPPAAAPVRDPGKAPHPLRPIEPIDRRASRPAAAPRPSRRLLGLGAAGSLAILAALAVPLAQKWREPQEVVDAPEVSPGDGERETESGSDSTARASGVATLPPTPQPGAIWYDPAIGMRFRYIPPGRFQMGSMRNEEGNAQQLEVELTRGFWMGETEVTQAQWKSLVGMNPSAFSGCGDDCPVEHVNWYEASEYANRLSDKAGFERCYEPSVCRGSLGLGCDGLFCVGDYSCARVAYKGHDCDGYRLPTEAEWEYAARATTKTALYSGHLTIRGENDSPELDEIAWYVGNGGVHYEGGFDCSTWPQKQYASTRCGTHPVGKKRENGWNLYDMLGNVSEWTWNWYDTYPESPAIDPSGPERGFLRVLRGGSWIHSPRDFHVAYRLHLGPNDHGAVSGFRLARTAN